jgi:replication factor A1
MCIISDIIGVVQSVSPTMSIRRKSDNETIIPKRDIVIADDSYVSLDFFTWLTAHNTFIC